MYKTLKLLEFQERFHGEEACLKYLFEKRWPGSVSSISNVI